MLKKLWEYFKEKKETQNMKKIKENCEQTLTNFKENFC